MSTRQSLCLALFAFLFAGSVPAGAESAAKGLLAGKVRSASAPLESVVVYAYQLADLSLQKVTTDEEGDFLFQELPAGLYKIVAHKRGFLPAVVTLARQSAAADQFVELQLVDDTPGDVESKADFWSVRRRIPTDVLRELEAEPVRSFSPEPPEDLVMASRQLSDVAAQFRAEMQALAGVDQTLAPEGGQMTGGSVALDGVVGNTKVDFDGSFMELQGTSTTFADGLKGSQRAISLGLEGEGRSQVSLTTRSSRLTDGSVVGKHPVDFENFQLSWTAPTGKVGQTQVSAQYTEENNFYNTGGVQPVDIPDASKTLNIQTSYSRPVGDQHSFQTQLRYRERERSYLTPERLIAAQGLMDARGGGLAQESVELSSSAGWRLQPTVLLEYGLTTKLLDGSLSFTPHGGIVIQLNDFWQMLAQFSNRVHDEDRNPYQDFIPAFFHESGSCDQAEEACYRFALTRQGKNEEQFKVAALHREFGETSRLFFNEDFFQNLESLFLVRGDSLPEFQIAVTQRLSPQVLTTLESNIAAGGGGLVYSVNDEPFENRLRYLVTSLDTQFEGTSTGVLLAFHHLQQQLESLAEGETRTQVEVERLQLKVTQNLSFLMDLAADWAVHLNMELSRGSTDFSLSTGTDDDEVRKSFLGGLAVRF